MSKTFLEQWVAGDAVAQGPAKQHEFNVYIPPLLEKLSALNVRSIVDFQADEGVVSVAFCAQFPGNSAVFVPPNPVDDPEGVFRKMAEDITAPLRKTGQVQLVAGPEDIKTASADAILLNNILGCQATLENVETIAATAGRVVKPDGYVVITVPNAHGREFSSYSCDNLPPKTAHGETYDFQMRGENAVFKNLYLSWEGLRDTFKRHGFAALESTPVPDRAYEGRCAKEPAFYQYAARKLSP